MHPTSPNPWMKILGSTCILCCCPLPRELVHISGCLHCLLDLYLLRSLFLAQVFNLFLARSDGSFTNSSHYSNERKNDFKQTWGRTKAVGGRSTLSTSSQVPTPRLRSTIDRQHKVHLQLLPGGWAACVPTKLGTSCRLSRELDCGLWTYKWHTKPLKPGLLFQVGDGAGPSVLQALFVRKSLTRFPTVWGLY